MGRATDDDPLTRAMAPPPDETEQQKQARLRSEAEARRVSDEIDEQIKEEKAAMKKKKKPIKVLLLGQSESGKSTTLKNFQIAYAAKAWACERAAWRTIVQLNLLRNVNTVLDVLGQEMSPPTTPEAAEASESEDDEQGTPSRANANGAARPAPLAFEERHRLLKLKLLPLRTLQNDIQARLGLCDYPTPPSKTDPDAETSVDESKQRNHELFVWSHAWKSALRTGSPGRRSLDNTARRASEEAETIEILASCREEIVALWADEVVQEMLKRRRVRLDLMPGFFIQETDRIAKREYTPSDDDVVRARLRTLGVQEHRIMFETGPAAGMEWWIYDVGGSRTQRPAWFPYFDDSDAIIFLAPISCFDEKLAEDRRVNRLEDSYQLWKMICSNKLLSNAQIILFLNKFDLLEKKLDSGLRVKDYVPSYGDRKNEAQAVAHYFAQHFREIAKQHTSAVRPFRVYTTSVVDTKATAFTLGTVGESILRTQLHDADLL